MRFISSALLALLFTSSTDPAVGAKRALMLGISEYDSLPDLRNPGNDVSNAAQKLRQVGYTVTIVPVTKTKRDDILQQFSSFLSTIAENDTVLIYYAGHGVDIDGDNELVPSDAPAPEAVLTNFILKNKLISFRSMMTEIEDRQPAVEVWIIDACRNNPYAALTRGEGPAGLKPIPEVDGRYVMYSAGYNQAAIDYLPQDPPRSKAGSPFSRTLVGLFDEGKSKDIDLFRRDIIQSLGPMIAPRKQRPTAENGINGEWCLDTCASAVHGLAVNASTTATQVAIKNAYGLFDVHVLLTAFGTAMASARGTSATIAPALRMVGEHREVVPLGKKSAAGCTLGPTSALYPFGCDTLAALVHHFDSGLPEPTSGLIGQTIAAKSEVKVRLGLPEPGDSGTIFGCEVRRLKIGDRVKLASTIALTYGGDTVYWGVVDGPEASCPSR